MAVAAWGQESGTATVHGRVLIQLLQEPVTSTISIDGRLAEAGADGLYRLAGVPPGHHILQVQSPGFKILRIEVDLKAGDDVELPVAEVRLADFCGSPDEPSGQLRWLRNEPRSGVMRGAIVGLRLRALDGVGVTLTDARGDLVRKVTGKAGQFLFEGLKPGEYGVRFDRAGYWPTTFHTTAVAGLEMDFGQVPLFACDDGVCREPRKVAPRYCE